LRQIGKVVLTTLPIWEYSTSLLRKIVMILNTQSPIPLYQQLASRLRQAIADGDLSEFKKIPSENVLAEQYGIGRPTVRQATDLLVREGALQRRRGSGTYVLPLARRIDLFSLAGTSAALRDSNLETTAVLLQRPEILGNGEYQPELFNNLPIYGLKRLTCIAKEPVLLEFIYLEANLFTGLERQMEAGDSLSRIVREVFHLEATSADQEYSITSANAETGQLLGVPYNTPLLHVGRTLHFGAHQSAIYCDIYCRTDRYRFTQTITTPDLQGKELNYAK
jgi:GntR family transcriptional regulator